MNRTHRVAVLVGSLRKESFSRKLARTLIELVEPPLALEIVEIEQLQMYNQDLDDAPPTEWTAFRSRIKAADAVLFVTPEYNRSVPGILKNAIDVGSRPYGQNAWNAKPGGVISVSPGALAAFGANHHLRQMLVFLNVPTMQQPEAYVGHAATLFDQQGRLTDEKTRSFLRTFMGAYAHWVERNTTG